MNNKKFCRHCKSQIDWNANICPFCRKKQNTSPALIIILCIVGVFVAGGVLASMDDKPKSAGSSSDSSSETKKDFEQNEIVEYRGVKYQVTGVKKSQGSTYDKPDSGKEFVIVKIKISNESKDKVSYNALDWKMTDSTGNEESETFTTVDSDTSMNSGNLDAGGVLEKTVTFEKPKNDTGLKLRYYDTIIDKDYAFQISIK